MIKSKVFSKSFMKIIFLLIFSIVLIFIVRNTINAYIMKKKVEEEIVKIEEKIKEYNEKKIKMEENIKNVTEDEAIERIARDKLNLKKEGEETYKIID